MKLPFKSIVVADYETFYDRKNKYSLGAMETTDYIVDGRFAIHCCSVRSPRMSKARVYRRLADAPIDWSTTAFVAHHCHFDAAIAAWREGIRPCFYIDTLSMARLIYGSVYPLGLHLLALRLGMPGKRFGGALERVEGKRILTAQEYRNLATYAGDDADQELEFFERFRPHISDDELRFIDLSIRMYVQPWLVMDGPMVEQLRTEDRARKEAAYASVKATETQLRSDAKFAKLLRDAGIDPPMRPKLKKGEWDGETMTYAFAKTSLGFKGLLKHKRKRVRDLTQARLVAKTTLVESRSTTFLRRSTLDAQPVYSKPYAARTLRDGGGDGTNFKNLPRPPKPGSKLREALCAPPGYKIIVRDQSQIEARLAANVAGQEDKLDAFRAFDAGTGPDVYRYSAGSYIYHKPVDDITTEERFLGKTAELLLQYQGGAAKFAHTVRIGQFGPPMDISDDDAEMVVKNWRRGHDKFSARYGVWRQIQRVATQAFLEERQMEFGPVVFEGYKGTGYMHLPNGTYVRYDDLQYDSESGQLSYLQKLAKKKKGAENWRKKIYGGILFENCQAAGTQVLTNRGWVAIESVLLTDLVHDGVEFVKHGGVVFKSVQPCVTVDGVLMTPDHEVLTDEGWKAALEKPRPYRPDLRHVDCVTTDTVRRQEDALAVSLPVREGSRADRYGRYEGQYTELRLSSQEAEDTRHELSPSVCGVSLDDRPMQAADTSSVEELRWAGNKGVHALVELREVLERHGGVISFRTNTGTSEQQSRLQAEQLLLGRVDDAAEQQAQLTSSRYESCFNEVQSEAVDAVLPMESRPVYDILNAGPRQRFVVRGDEGPFVVHNCIQALSRVLLAGYALGVIEEVPLAKIVLMTYDELVMVHPERGVERAAEKVTKIMRVRPSWAPDVPLNVAGGIYDRYVKE